jgi:hypothetical protein
MHFMQRGHTRCGWSESGDGQQRALQVLKEVVRTDWISALCLCRRVCCIQKVMVYFMTRVLYGLLLPLFDIVRSSREDLTSQQLSLCSCCSACTSSGFVFSSHALPTRGQLGPPVVILLRSSCTSSGLIGYLTTLYQLKGLITVGWDETIIMYGELERILKGKVVSFFKILSRL